MSSAVLVALATAAVAALLACSTFSAPASDTSSLHFQLSAADQAASASCLLFTGGCDPGGGLPANAPALFGTRRPNSTLVQTNACDLGTTLASLSMERACAAPFKIGADAVAITHRSQPWPEGEPPPLADAQLRERRRRAGGQSSILTRLLFLWASVLMYFSGSAANSCIWKHSGFLVEPPPKHFYFQDEPNDWVHDADYVTSGKAWGFGL